MTLTLRDLFLQTLRSPAEAAQMVLSFPIARRELYMALMTGAALNAVLSGVAVQLFPLPDELPAFIAQPFSYFAIVAGTMVLFAHILTWAGRSMGGSGALEGILKLMIWLQFVRLPLQVVGLIVTVLLPELVRFYSLAVAGLSLWILLHFIRTGHGLTSLGHAAFILVGTFIGLLIGLSILFALIGIGPVGGLSNV